jgi:DNA polymerase-1
MLLQVHDDLLFEVPNNEVDTILKLAKTKMESALKLNIPLIVDIKTGKNWAQMEKLK